MSEPRQIPANELDFQLQLTNSVWGNPNISPELKEKLKYIIKNQYKKGDIRVNEITGELEEVNKDINIEEKASLWGLLNFYTRDFRLGNLDKKQFEYCRFYADYASIMLKENMVAPFLICIGRIASVLELSQSINGFVRKQLNTITTEQKVEETSPEKKDLLGRPKK